MRVRVQANSVRQKFSSSCTSTFLGCVKHNHQKLRKLQNLIIYILALISHGKNAILYPSIHRGKS